jgi:drug/metabolite transporter (DMT)-like permease
MRLAPLALLAVSALWGTTFVAVKAGLEDASPLLFLGIRFAIATLASLPLLRRRPGLGPALRAGVPLGIVFALGYAAQTIGLTTTTPSRSAFLTGLNVAMVPLWAALLLRIRPARLALVGLAVTIPGMWLLTAPGAGGWSIGDAWTVGCALMFALHVVLIGRVGGRHDVSALLVSQLAVTAILCLGAAPLLETPSFTGTPRLALALGLTALAGTIATTWLQLRFQPYVDPARAGLIYATEPAFAALFSWLVFRETLPLIAWAGAALILAGMILSEAGSGRRGDPAGTPLAEGVADDR